MRYWTLTVSAVTEDGGYEQSYTNRTGELESADFARGFALGYAAANGVPPEAITCRLVESDD